MRKQIILLSIIPVIGFTVGCYLLWFYECGASISCYDITTKVQALYYGMGALLLVLAVLFVFPKAFNAWKRFAVWFVPVVAIIFLLQDDKGQGFMEISPSSVHVFQGLSALYILISLIIIAISVYKARGRK